MAASQSDTFVGHLFDWQIDRNTRSYRVVVVEPSFIEPSTHAAIFKSAIATLLFPESAPVSALRHNDPPSEQFDLLTFPEAFLPASDLVATIRDIAGVEDYGCVHVGLRPSIETGHLFTCTELSGLVAALQAIPEVEGEDIAKFDAWLQQQPSRARFNVACLFTVDIETRIRICLHPKMVRSRFEAHALPELDMTQANVLTLVTLLPKDPNYLAITMQPLICSDTLQLDTDHPGHLPLSAINSAADAFRTRPPDYVDVVTVTTCTPQTETSSPGLPNSRSWHYQFQKAFTEAAGNPSFQRHAHAAFVLSNFWAIGTREDPNPLPGGLSGVFLPMKPGDRDPPQSVQISTYGDFLGESSPNWTRPGTPLDGKRRVRGFLAQLNPHAENLPRTRMQGFTINRLPRHVAPWGATVGLRGFTARSAEPVLGNAIPKFVEEDNVDAS
ncbi:hypothetical protein B5V01_21880 [Mesorhizobium erdmanii]|uniref:Uncharacterized protein n=2 Tax=Mesorhizobium TaxID=68287 RepID=A0A3M9X4S2_9HYPH|nr:MULTISPECIES: hypothetical protein [Mesorhizobium]RNJ42686.1 hypothetical protein DNR46_26495 [Mesorhizobium japonicum]RXT42553.1 hypothetical protein B5V01_21880 [Mesorhizobium erdmanii]